MPLHGVKQNEEKINYLIYKPAKISTYQKEENTSTKIEMRMWMFKRISLGGICHHENQYKIQTKFYLVPFSIE